MSTKKLIAELEKIGDQSTIPASILLAIRARMEAKSGIKNRIGKTFPNGNRGVLLVGKAGSGKTRAMSRLFNGLALNGVNAEGQTIGKWLPSTGGSTGVGIYEVLEVYNDSIIFADELSLDTEKHVHVMKQIANGELVRPRHGNIEATPFSGLLIGATNAVKLPGNRRELEHLLATLDRFMVVRVTATATAASDTMQIALTDEAPPEPDWAMIAKALMRQTTIDLNDEEKSLIKKIWADKTREILDPTRAQWRNSHAVLDIFLFCKRFFGVKDLTNDLAATQFAKQMINDCVLFNPVSLLWLSPLEQVIYDCIKAKNVVSMQEVISAVLMAGISTTRMTIHRTMGRMQENYLIHRRSHGKYSTKLSGKAYNVIDKSETSEGNESQVDIPQVITDLASHL